MENNEKNQSGAFHENNHRRKKRYKNKYHRKPAENSKNTNIHDDGKFSQKDSITMLGGRYDLPPNEPQTYEISNASDTGVLSQKRHENHNSHHAKKHNFECKADAQIKENSESTVSEYTLVAGEDSIEEKEEIIAEINSVSISEAEAIENGTSSDISASTESADEVELQKYEVIGVRFKVGGKVYYFAANSHVLSKGQPVIVETARGVEYGICEISNKIVTERDIIPPLRNTLRKANEEDIKRHELCVAHEKEAAEIFSQKIIEHKLGMKFIDVEYAFDGSKLLFYFTAEGRVDFRELVKDLASVFRIRIELRQIGIRDETKLLGGIGLCGRPFCCKTFLSDFVQVSIKMAKEQNLSLNSQKISGACGRLMCCLRYEYETYQEEIKKTPKVDQIVSTPDGDGTVIEVQPLAGLIRVRFGAKTDMIPPKVYHRDDVTVIGGKGVKPAEPPKE